VIFKVWRKNAVSKELDESMNSSKREEDRDSLITRQMNRLLDLLDCTINEPSILSKIKQIQE